MKIGGEYLLQVSQPGLTLESLDAISSSIDALTTSLDDFSTSVTPELAAFDISHMLNFFRGPNLEATLDTAEQGTDGRRLKVRGFRPVTDAPSVVRLRIETRNPAGGLDTWRGKPDQFHHGPMQHAGGEPLQPYEGENPGRDRLDIHRRRRARHHRDRKTITRR